MGEKLQTGRNPPAGSKEEAGKLGKNSKQEETPQPEADRKQAGWVKNSKQEEIPQPEAKRKQASWVKTPNRRKLPNRKLIGSKQVG